MPIIHELAPDQILPDPDNPRSGDLEGIDELAANIEALGLINPITVRLTGHDDGRELYTIVAGHRRFAAMQKLECRSIPATVVRVKTGTELALTENIMRQAMHPVDEYRAFAKLRLDGVSLKKIGKHFSLTERQVKQRLALGSILPAWLDAWRNGWIDDEIAKKLAKLKPGKQAEAFDEVFSADQDPNERALEPLDAWDLREYLDKDERLTEANSKVQIVGMRAYLDAGGRVEQDLFGDQKYLTNPGLIEKLYDERMDGLHDEVKAEGWRTVWWNQDPEKPTYVTHAQVYSVPTDPKIRANTDVVISFGYGAELNRQCWQDKPMTWEQRDRVKGVAEKVAQQLVDEGYGHEEAVLLVIQWIEAGRDQLLNPPVGFLDPASGSVDWSTNQQEVPLIPPPSYFEEGAEVAAVVTESPDVVLKTEDGALTIGITADQYDVVKEFADQGVPSQEAVAAIAKRVDEKRKPNGHDA